jgi:hypothetical protein
MKSVVGWMLIALTVVLVVVALVKPVSTGHEQPTHVVPDEGGGVNHFT